MSDPADKSDDLIAELAKLMAANPGNGQSSVQPMNRPAPLDPLATRPSSAPPPVRIPGMSPPMTAAPAPTPAPQPAPRGPVTGAIRIPGMDQPAPVSTSAPVSKFDFGKPITPVAPIKQEPLSTLSERLAAQNPMPAPRIDPVPSAAGPAAPVRIPSDLKPVSENTSFAMAPALSVATAAPAAGATSAAPPASGRSDFHFDFGFSANPPAPAAPPRPTAAEPQHDPIADLIAQETGDSDGDALPRAEVRPIPVAPVQRTAATPQPAAAKPIMSPVSPATPRPAGAAPIPLKPVSVAPRAPEADRFAISPGVGLNMKPPANQPLNPPVHREPAPAPVADDSDPMSQIESLIGEAVRVELSAPGPVKVQAPQPVTPKLDIEPDADIEATATMSRPEPAPAPTVPPLTSQFAPRRSSLKEDAGQASAEDAILAAAAATGARVDRLEPSVTDESPYRRLKVKPAKSSFMSGGMRQYVGMAVAGTLLLAAGLGLYWVLNMGRANINTAATAPELTADATPVKEVPPVSAEATDTARSPVLDQIDGTSVEPSAEQLVSTDETNDGTVARDVTATPSTDTEGGLANRKVRTVTVRPDGTIVSGDDAVAGAEELPVERPNVPVVPSTESTNLLGDNTSAAMTDPVEENTALASDALAPIIDTAADPAASDAVTSDAVTAVYDPTIVPPKPASFPVRSEVAAIAPEPEAPLAGDLTGAQTPDGQIDLLAGETPLAAVEPEPASPVTAAAYVQLSSSPTRAEAEGSVRSNTNRYGSLFGGAQLIIQSADLGQKGTWYRVRLPVSSLGEATRICADIKANGGDCIATGG